MRKKKIDKEELLKFIKLYGKIFIEEYDNLELNKLSDFSNFDEIKDEMYKLSNARQIISYGINTMMNEVSFKFIYDKDFYSCYIIKMEENFNLSENEIRKIVIKRINELITKCKEEIENSIKEYRDKITSYKNTINNFREEIDELNYKLVTLLEEINYKTRIYDLENKLKDFNKDAFCYELCPECGQEQIIFTKGITKCPECGTLLFPCSQCMMDDADCNQCEYEKLYALNIYNREITDEEKELFEYYFSIKDNKGEDEDE